MTDLPRPDSCPRRGDIAAFDAGWDAHKAGIGRDTVLVLAHDRGWSVLGWDVRQHVSMSATKGTESSDVSERP